MLEFVVTLIVIGVGLWLLNTYVPMAQPIKTIINVVVILCVVLWVLQVFGLFDVPVPRFHPRYERRP